MKKFLLSVIAILCAITISANDLKIFNQLISSSHGSVWVPGELDFLKEGTIFWDGSTLTLSSVVLEGYVDDNWPIIGFSDASAVTIKLSGDNVINDKSNGKGVGLEVRGKTTIVCENEKIHELGYVASLTLNLGPFGIMMFDGSSLFLDRVNVSVNSTEHEGITNPSGVGDVKIEVKNDTKLEINCPASQQAIRGNIKITLGNKEAIAEPAGAQLSDGYVRLNGHIVKEHLVVDRLEWEASTFLITTKARINNINASHLEQWYPEIIKDGKVSFDNDTKTLTLDNATIAPDFSDYGISISGNETASIELIGENFINTARQGITSAANSNLTIKGSGKLNINAQNHYAIDVAKNSSVTIDNTTLALSGSDYGVYGRDNSNTVLNINNSEVTIDAAAKGVLTGFKEAKLTDCKVLEPQGAIIAAGSAYDSNGELLTARLVIGNEKADALELISSGDINLLENPQVRVYNVVGQDVTSMKDNLPQGNYILRAGNQVQKISVR